jgi:hypothetical protein
MTEFFKRIKNDSFLKVTIQIVCNVVLLDYVILPMLNMSSTVMFFAGMLLAYLLVTVNLRIFKKLY